MPYIGNTAGNRFVASKAATQFSGNGILTDFTLDHSVGSDEDILVSVDGVIQEPSVAYSVSGTTLSFTAAPSNNSGNNIFVYYLFRTVGTIDHPATSALSATSGTFSSSLTVANGITLSDGNLTVASGHGIDFSANSSASGMSSELFDHYEEGTFSVTIRDATSGGNTGSVSQSNKYVRIGNKVWMHFNLINITTTGLTSGNNLYFTGLPFTPATGSNGCGSIFLDRFNIDNNRYQVNIFQNAGQSYATVLQNADFGASSATGSTAVVSLFDNATADLFGTYMIEV